MHHMLQHTLLSNAYCNSYILQKTDDIFIENI